MMTAVLTRIRRGLLGHPGLLWGVVLPIVGAVAGDTSAMRALAGALILGAYVWVPILFSAWERGEAGCA